MMGRELGLRVGVLALGGLGGSGRVACDLARGIADRGHRAFVLTARDTPWRSELGLRVTHVVVDAPIAPPEPDDAWIDPLAEQVAAAVRERGISVLSVHYGRGLAAAAIRARRALRSAGFGAGPRICVTLHGSDVTALADSPTEARRLADDLADCDEVTSVSHWLADAAVETLALPRRPRVIHNGVDTSVFRPADAQMGHRPRLVHASNFRAIKRPLDAIRVLAALHHDGIDAVLTMIGDGPLRPAAMRLAAELGIADAVRFVGPLVPVELADRLRRSDLALVTSASESFGLVALEALASGTPLVGTRCGGLEEVLGSDPVLVERSLSPVGDVARLATRIGAILRNPADRADLRARGLAIGRHAFGRTAMVDAYIETFGRVLRSSA